MTELPLLAPEDLQDFQSGNVDLNLAAAIETVRGYCGWHIAPERTETLVLQAAGGRVILPTLHATVVTVESDGGLVDPADYTLNPGYIAFKLPYFGEVTVVLTHGYDELPADIKRVVLSMANDGTAIGGRLKSAGPFTYEFPDGSADAGVLDRYRLPSVS